MTTADRRLLQVTLAGWGVFSGWLFYRFFVQEASAEPFDGMGYVMVFGFLLFLLVGTAFLGLVVIAIPFRLATNLLIRCRRVPYRRESIVLASILACFIALAVFDWTEKERLAPKDGVDSLPDFAITMPPPQELRIKNLDGKHYFVWTGESMNLLTAPSGPSLYVFDESGSLVDWQPETGDGGPMQSFAGNMTLVKSVTAEEAIRELKR